MKGASVISAGPAVGQAPAVIVLVHGRGGTADDMIHLYQVLHAPWCAAVAPQAPGGTWYPHSFLAPLEDNQPNLDHSLNTLGSVIEDLMKAGLSADRIVLMGFSQGACLCAEFAARNPRQYGAIICLSGGLIGPPGTKWQYPGSLGATPVFLGASDPDPHVPFARVRETEAALSAMGAAVQLRRYPNMGHTINDDELAMCRDLIGHFQSRSV